MPSVEEALAPLAASLAAEGFELTVAERDDAPPLVRVRAGAAACEYCLISRRTFESMAAERLAQHGLPTAIDLDYPEPPA